MIGTSLKRLSKEQIIEFVKEFLQSVNDPASLCPLSAIGFVAVFAEDELVTALCLKRLCSLLDTPSSRKAFLYRQICLVGGRGNFTTFLSIIETLSIKFEQADSKPEIGQAFSELASLTKGQNDRVEGLLAAVLRLYVKTSLSHVKIRNSSNKPSAVGFPQDPLEALHPAIAQTASLLDWSTVVDRSALVGLFQEFWFASVFHGYQPNLRWPDSWMISMTSIAIHSPALLSERERLSSNPMSQILLSREPNPLLRAHVLTLISSTRLHPQIKTMNLGQCLWFLSVYQCQLLKFKSNQFDTALDYLSSDIVHSLNLYGLVEAGLFHIVDSWLADFNPITSQKAAVELLIIIVSKMGYTYKDVHKACIELFRLIYTAVTPFSMDLLHRIAEKVCRQKEVLTAAENFEKLEGDDWYIRDPDFAAVAYSDCLELAKDVFTSVAQTHTGSLIHFLGRCKSNDALLRCLHLVVPVEFYQKAVSVLLSRTSK